MFSSDLSPLRSEMRYSFFRNVITYQTARPHVLENDLVSYLRHKVKLLQTRYGMYIERKVMARWRNHYCHGN